MKRLLITLAAAIMLTVILAISVFAASTYTVAKGDTLWKIAVKHQIGLSEIKEANPQIKNYDLIYPNQVINLPTKNQEDAAYENEVIRLVNTERKKSGLEGAFKRLAAIKGSTLQVRGYEG